MKTESRQNFWATISFLLLLLGFSSKTYSQDIGWNYAGNGMAPNADELMSNHALELKGVKSDVGVDSKGQSSYSIGIDLLPAVLSPKISVGYSSQTLYGGDVSNGWNLNAVQRIRKPVGRELNEYAAGEYIYEGPYGGGRFYLSGADYKLQGGGGYTEAEYDAVSNAWTVYSGDIELEFTSYRTDLADTYEWLLTKIVNKRGFMIEFFYGVGTEYHHRHLIQINYNENDGSGPGASFSELVKVVFEYDERTRILKRMIPDYYMDETRYELGKIKIQSKNGAGAFETRYQYRFVREEFDEGVEILKKIIKEDDTGTTSEELAVFDYYIVEDDATGGPMLDMDHDVFLGQTRGNSVSSTPVSSSKTYVDVTLMDVNGDRNLDRMFRVSNTSSTDSDRSHHYLNYDRVTGEYEFADEDSWPYTYILSYGDAWVSYIDDLVAGTRAAPFEGIYSLPGIDGAAVVTETENEVEHGYSGTGPRKSWTTQNTLDMNADGYPDVVSCDDTYTWKIYYGDGRGFATDGPEPDGSYLITAPWLYCETSYATSLSHPGDLQGKTRRMVDINGDGYPDLYNPITDQVWYKDRVKGGGYSGPFSLGTTFSSVNTYDHDADMYTYSTGEVPHGGSGSYPPLPHAYAFRTKEKKGFYDINGDGFIDRVNATVVPWQVYLGKGSQGFEPVTTWSTPAGVTDIDYIKRSLSGYPAGIMLKEVCTDPTDPATCSDVTYVSNGRRGMTLQQLKDMDADGLPDLLRIVADYTDFDPAGGEPPATEIGWYKNLGDGFSDTIRDFPEWMPTIYDSSVTYSLADCDADHCTDETRTEQRSLITDLNGDGNVDYAGIDGVVFSDYTPQYRLKSVHVNKSLGQTKLEYESSSRIYPAGVPAEDQYLRGTRIDAVTQTEQTELVSSKTAWTDRIYKNPHFSETGRFEGFETIQTYQTVGGVEVSRTKTDFRLDDLFGPRPERTEVTDRVIHNGVYGEDSGFGLSQTSDLEYITIGSGTHGRDLWLVNDRTIATILGEVTGTLSLETNKTFDSYARVTEATTEKVGGSEYKRVAITYTADADQRVVRMSSQKHYSGPDAPSLVSEKRFFYDGNALYTDAPTFGELTKEQVFAGWVDGGETLDLHKLDTLYFRGDYGEVVRIESPEIQSTDAGLVRIFENRSYGFGYAVQATTSNALGHTATNEIDGWGRVWRTTDPNGFKLRTAYDDLGRKSDEYEIPVGGVERRVKSFEYHEPGSPAIDNPRYTGELTYDWSGAVESRAYQTYTGFGAVIETSKTNPFGTLTRTNTIQDLRGVTLATYRPEVMVGGTYSFDRLDITVGDVQTEMNYDGFGRARQSYPDKTFYPLKSSQSYFETPFTDRSVDPEGYEKKSTKDAFGRVIQIEEGDGTTWLQTGEYQYDILDRLTRFIDKDGNAYVYSYDGAGRLRQVKKGITEWYSYNYQGMLMQDQIVGNPLNFYSSRRSYDRLGRVRYVSIQDPLKSSGYMTYETTYDVDWIGTISEVRELDAKCDAVGCVGPMTVGGKTTYEYETTRGLKTEERRDFGATHADVFFGYTYDGRGRLTQTTTPGTTTITPTYNVSGYVSRDTVVATGVPSFQIDYTYNKYETISQWTSSGIRGKRYFDDTPLWPNKLQLIVPDGEGDLDYTLRYGFQPNGLLDSKQFLSEVLYPGGVGEPAPYTYGYNLVKFNTSVDQGATPIERATYFTNGDLDSITEPDGTVAEYDLGDWGSYGQLMERDHGTDTETYTYHPTTGNVTQINYGDGTTHSFEYDGLNRLRVIRNGGGAQLFKYTYQGTSDTVIREAIRRVGVGGFDHIHKFLSWREESETGREVEQIKSFLDLEDTGGGWQKHFHLVEADGNRTVTVDSAGDEVGKRLLGVYGLDIMTSGAPWDVESFHGMEETGRSHFYYQMGHRFMMKGSGQWLMPEPLLYEGLGDSAYDPLNLSSYRYARNNSVSYSDRTGYDPTWQDNWQAMDDLFERAYTAMGVRESWDQLDRDLLTKKRGELASSFQWLNVLRKGEDIPGRAAKIQAHHRVINRIQAELMAASQAVLDAKESTIERWQNRRHIDLKVLGETGSIKEARRASFEIVKSMRPKKLVTTLLGVGIGLAVSSDSLAAETFETFDTVSDQFDPLYHGLNDTEVMVDNFGRLVTGQMTMDDVTNPTMPFSSVSPSSAYNSLYDLSGSYVDWYNGNRSIW